MSEQKKSTAGKEIAWVIIIIAVIAGLVWLGNATSPGYECSPRQECVDQYTP